jgi:hypothetical protein
MSDPAGEIQAITAQLRTIAERLRAPGLGDEEAERLAREAADLVAKAGNELERAQSDARDE